MNGIGKNIKKLRKERGLSQEQLAKQLHVTRQAVSSWETGKNQPDIETLESIAAVFDTDILIVLYGRPRTGDGEGKNLGQKRVYIRNGLIWGAIALAGLVIHLVVKDRIMDWYYRFQYTAFVVMFGLFIRPLSIFAAAAAFMNGISLIGNITIGKVWIRRTVLGVTFTALTVYLAAALLCLISGLGYGGDYTVGRMSLFSAAFQAVVRIITMPALFLIPGIGLFLGRKEI